MHRLLRYSCLTGTTSFVVGHRQFRSSLLALPSQGFLACWAFHICQLSFPSPTLVQLHCFRIKWDLVIYHYLHAVEYCSSLLYWPLTISDTEYFGKELVMEGRGREAVLRAYEELKLTHPELPSQLHNFQVACTSLWRFFGHNFCFCRLTFWAELWTRRWKGT